MVSMEMNLEEVEREEVLKGEIGCKKELVDCRCSELKEISKKAEARCAELESDIQKKNRDNEALEAKLRAMESDQHAIEDELKVVKRENDELKKHVSRVKGESEVISGREGIVDLTVENEEEDKLVGLMVENKVLECEKKRAESEVEIWKEKFKGLESWVLELDQNSALRCVEWPLIGGAKLGLGLTNVDSSQVSDRKEVIGRIRQDNATNLDRVQNKAKVENPVGLQKPGFFVATLVDDSPYKGNACGEEEKKGAYVEHGRKVRKQLPFENEKSPNKKLAPPTPGSARPASLGIVDISDSDEEQTTQSQLPPSHNKGIQEVHHLGDCTLASSVGSEKEMVSGNGLKQPHYTENEEEDMDAGKDNLLFTQTPRRKRASNVVISSDTESDVDDNILISRLKRMRLQEKVPGQVFSDLNNCSVTATTLLGDNVKGIVTPRRRRLLSLRNREGKGEVERNSSSQASEVKYHQGIPTTEDVQDDDSEEVKSDSEGESLGGFIVESSEGSHADDASNESQEVSDENVDFDEILSKLQRNRDLKAKWEFEADMLAAFGKDTELCMKAVCALYRQQTSEEKFSKEAFYHNHRGFSKSDASRGSTLAEFLIGEDPGGDLKKSLKELEDYDRKAVQLCRTLATRYSKQLFEIYKNKEDPLFLPSLT